MRRITWTCRCGAQRVETLRDSQRPVMPGWTNNGPWNVPPKCPDCVAGLTPIFVQLCKELRITIVREAA